MSINICAGNGVVQPLKVYNVTGEVGKEVAIDLHLNVQEEGRPLGIDFDYFRGHCSQMPLGHLHHSRGTFLHINPDGTVKPKHAGPGKDFLQQCSYNVTSGVFICKELPYGEQCIEVKAVRNFTTSVPLRTIFIDIESSQKGRGFTYESYCSCGETCKVMQLLLVMVTSCTILRSVQTIT